MAQSLFWLAIVSFLYGEITFTILLLLPYIPVKLWRALFNSRIFGLLSEHGRFYFYCLAGVLFLVFVDSIRTSWQAEEKRHLNEPNTHVHLEVQERLYASQFRSQRNIYISGFSLFLVFVIKRLVTLLLERAKLEANLIALEKQAKQAALAAGLAPLAPIERERERAEPDAGVEKKSAAAAASSRSEDASALKTEMRRAEELQTKLDAAVRERERAKKDMEAMREQALNVKAEFDRLLAEHTNLQRKCKQLEAGDSGDSRQTKKDD